ncbi:ROK family protein [Bacillaceae bacterium S4-13-58]
MFREFFQEKAAKYQSIKQVYYFIHKYGPITKAELLELTQLKQTTMVRHLEELLNRNYIKIKSYEKSTGGRPPALYEINPFASYIIGIDLSRTRTEILLLDLNFIKRDNYSFVMSSEHTPEVTILLLKRKIRELLDKNGIKIEQLLGIGIGAVGPIDRENGIILHPDLFPAPGWNYIPIVKELETTFGTKVMIENGANTAALGEYSATSVPYSNYLYCISGRGLRCGVLTNGQFMKNNTGDASSFGEIIIDIDVKNPKENKTLSTYTSLDYMLKETKRRISNGESSSLLLYLNNRDVESATINDFLVALKNGDKLIQDIVHKSAYYYGIGLANIINIIHPEKVILKSLLIDVYPSYFDNIIEIAKQYIYRYDQAKVSFGKGQLENAVSIGASVLVFNSFFE